MAKRPVPLYDFKAFGAAIKAASNEYGESRKHYSCSDPENQAITLAVMLSRRFLGNSGAVRVHGGGFAGTIQAFVPVGLVDDYINEMNRIFGEKSCTKMKIRPVGGVEITKE